ncbi:hypothetical protein AB0J86_18410 [Micromonospora sp. NPDC049559]|uniref:hypothetical protein n=1 Tax=Micromonospora sp. NPDC049559 TaxID=3155923 RepID=UPI00343C4412
MSRRDHPSTGTVLTGLALVSAAAVFVAPAPAALVGGLLLALVLPGAALTRMLFPGRVVSVAEWTVLAPAFSLATLVLGGLGLYAADVRLTREAWCLLTAVVTVVAAVTAQLAPRVVPPLRRAAGATAARLRGPLGASARWLGRPAARLAGAVGAGWHAVTAPLAARSRRARRVEQEAPAGPPEAVEQREPAVPPEIAEKLEISAPSAPAVLAEPAVVVEPVEGVERPDAVAAPAVVDERVPDAAGPTRRPYGVPARRPERVSFRRAVLRLVPLALAAVLLAGTGWYALDGARHQPTEPFTALEMVPAFATETPGPTRTVSLGLRCEERAETDYVLVVRGEGGFSTTLRTRLRPATNWARRVQVPSTGRVTVELYRAGDTTPYRTVFLDNSQ